MEDDWQECSTTKQSPVSVCECIVVHSWESSYVTITSWFPVNTLPCIDLNLFDMFKPWQFVHKWSISDCRVCKSFRTIRHTVKLWLYMYKKQKLWIWTCTFADLTSICSRWQVKQFNKLMLFVECKESVLSQCVYVHACMRM